MCAVFSFFKRSNFQTFKLSKLKYLFFLVQQRTTERMALSEVNAVILWVFCFVSMLILSNFNSMFAAFMLLGCFCGIVVVWIVTILS